jgi:hypothetical protein
LVEGVPVIAVWKSEVEYVFESKPAVLYKSQPGVTERWPKPDVIERLTKQGVSTLRSFRPKGGTPQMKSAIRWHNEQGQPVVYYQMDFARSGWGDFTTPDGKRSPILEDFVADSPWMLRFNHGTLEKAQWGTHRFLNEPMELSLTANLKGKVYFIPTTSKVAPGRGVRVNFTFADWFGGSVTTEVKGCTTLGVPMKVPTPPPGKSESMLLFREIVVNLDPSAQSLCPK